MLFSESRRSPSDPATAAAGAAVAALVRLREATLPQLATPPRFVPRAQMLSQRPSWLRRLLRRSRRPAAFAGGCTAIVVLLSTASPVWGSLASGSEVDLPSTAPSIAQRLDDLGVPTFVGNLLFVQQTRLVSAEDGSSSGSEAFIAGAREARLAEYLGFMSEQVALLSLSDAIITKRTFEYFAALAEAQRREELLATVVAVQRAPAPGIGVAIPNTWVTFYACIGNGFCGNMATGQQVFAGAAACSYNLPFGTRFVIAGDPTGRTYTCLDRGLPGPTWVDIWFYDAADGYAWQAQMPGSRHSIIIVE